MWLNSQNKLVKGHVEDLCELIEQARLGCRIDWHLTRTYKWSMESSWSRNSNLFKIIKNKLKCLVTASYGNTGCWVFMQGVQNWKYFCLKINIPKGNYWISRIGLGIGLSSLQKSEFVSWLFHSSIIFDAKIEISGTKWVEKTPIYIFSTFGSKINECEWKKLEKNEKNPKT